MAPGDCALVISFETFNSFEVAFVSISSCKRYRRTPCPWQCWSLALFWSWPRDLNLGYALGVEVSPRTGTESWLPFFVKCYTDPLTRCHCCCSRSQEFVPFTYLLSYWGNYTWHQWSEFHPADWTLQRACRLCPLFERIFCTTTSAPVYSVNILAEWTANAPRSSKDRWCSPENAGNVYYGFIPEFLKLISYLMLLS